MAFDMKKLMEEAQKMQSKMQSRLNENRPLRSLRGPVVCTGCKMCYYIEKLKHDEPCQFCNSRVEIVSESHAMALIKHALSLDRAM